MRTNSIMNTEVLNADKLVNELIITFPWIGSSVIKVSYGLKGIVNVFFEEIEEILSKDPNLMYLRIVEEYTSDKPYQKFLKIFIEHNANGSKAEALHYATNKAKENASSICYQCSDPLKDVYDIDTDQFAFLSDDFFKGNKHNSAVCLHCAENEWIDNNQKNEQKKVNSNSDIAEENLFDFDTEESTDELLDDLNSGDNNSEQNQITEHQTFMLYPLSLLDKIENDYKHAAREQTSRVKGLVRRLRESSPEKKLISIPDDWRSYCEQLEQDFPNFKEVVQFISNNFALSSVGDCLLHFPPFLLVGGAGVGKTEFMLTLAQSLLTHLDIIDMSNDQSGSALSGSEEFWGNSQTGRLFNALAFGEEANPIIMLDEIDKARNDESFQSLSALHMLLEPRQAKQFYDLSLPALKMDASKVIWIATANNIELIAKPIIDRFTVFHIEQPTKEQMNIIVKNQYDRFLNQHSSGAYFESEIREEVTQELCLFHPRKVRKILIQAFGLAAYKQRNYLTINDIRLSSGTKKEKSTGIGFLCSDI